MGEFVELNGDQRRETVNTRQRYQAWRAARDRENGYRGSMVWDTTKGRDYLLRAFYDESGVRRQKSLGVRSAETERLKTTFDTERQAARESRASLDTVMKRQGAVNRALGLGRVPLLAARILRLLDERDMLGHGLKVVGTHALYAYEAAAGVMFDPGLTATGDLDLLLDARSRLSLVGAPAFSEEGLIGLLRKADRSFRRSRQAFRAENDEGYMVDLIAPMRHPPWSGPVIRQAPGDLAAAEIEGLAWLENAPPFEQLAIDERGSPLRIVTIDPRVFAIHKRWVAGRPERDPVKRRRDSEQSSVVLKLTLQHLPHLALDPSELRMIPAAIVRDALAGS